MSSYSPKQRIDLYKSLPTDYSLLPTPKQILLAWLLTIVFLLLYGATLFSNWSNLTARFVQLNSSFATKIANVEERFSLRAADTDANSLVAIAAKNIHLGASGFSADLLALAHNHSKDVWFNSIELNNSSESYKMSGSTISLLALHDLSTKIKSLPQFKGYNLSLTQVKSSDNKEKQQLGVLHNFTLGNGRKIKLGESDVVLD